MKIAAKMVPTAAAMAVMLMMVSFVTAEALGRLTMLMVLTVPVVLIATVHAAIVFAEIVTAM